MKKGRVESRWQKMAKYRLGNDMRGERKRRKENVGSMEEERRPGSMYGRIVWGGRTKDLCRR